MPSSKDKQVTSLSIFRGPLGWVAAGLLVIVAAGAFFLTQAGKNNQAQTADLEDPSIGPKTAKVTIVEYGDFGCPTCKAWQKMAVMEQVLLHYGENVRFVWRDFPIITAQSPKAAEAARCAQEQGKFWEYHDLLYFYAPQLGIEDLKKYAADVKLDTQKFNQCLDSGKYRNLVERNQREAESLGFTGTPSFLINSEKLAGPPSFDDLKRRIDPMLNQVQ